MLAAVRRRILLLYPLHLRLFSAAASTTADREVSYLISKYGLSAVVAARIAPLVRLASRGSTSNADAVLALLRRYGFTGAEISRTVSKFPTLLASDPAKTLQPKLDFLASVGVTPPLFGRLVSLSPAILHRSVESHLVPLFDSLRDILGSNSKIVSVLRRMPFVIRCNPKVTLFQALPTLRNVHGITSSEISMLVAVQPGVILLGPDRLDEIVQAIKNTGVEPGKPMFVHIFGIFCRMKAPTLEKKFAVYQSLGFDKNDVHVMLRRYPPSMAVSGEKLKKTIGFLIGKAGVSKKDIISYPNTLVRSLGSSHCRRCAVLTVLRREGKPEGEHRVIKVLTATAARFMQVYVRPHQNEVPDVLRAINGEIPFEGFGGGSERQP